MAGSWRLFLCVVAISSLAVSSAQAFNGRSSGWWSTPPSYSYYYAAPYYYYCPPPPRVIPVPDARATPPSQSAEPPLQKKMVNDPRMPIISGTHAVGRGFVPGASSLAKDRCRVGFWNVSGRTVTLTIDGKAYELAKDRTVTLDLARQFSWQVAGHLQHVERVADGQMAHEVVIRE